jgi:hypothetical protein
LEVRATRGILSKTRKSNSFSPSLSKTLSEGYNIYMRTVYLETSVVSYLTSHPRRDVRVATWQEITNQWWEQERAKFELFTSELVIAEASRGDMEAARERLERLKNLPVLTIDEEPKRFADRLIREGGVPAEAQADALHIAVASVHGLDYLLTWNCRHINNAATKPLIRSICAIVGYPCPEICTPLELLSEENGHVPR